MPRVPFPGGGDDVFELWILRFPAQFTNGFFGGGDEFGRITRAARFLNRRDFLSAHLLAHLDDLADGIAVAVAQIVKALLARREREDVRLREIDDVNVVADARAVG